MIERPSEQTSGHEAVQDGSVAEAAADRQSNPAGRPTAAELERRKVKVMEVATDLFVHNGYAATSLLDIAKQAGVATRTLYQHFGDKESLFREVIFARDTGAVIPVPALEAGDTLASALDKMARYILAYSMRPRPIDLMRLMIAESRRFPELIRSVVAATFSRFQRNIARMFEGLATAKLIPDGDHDRLAVLFSDVILGSQPIMTYTEWTTDPLSEEEIDRRVEFFILGAFGPLVARKAHSREARLRKVKAAPVSD